MAEFGKFTELTFVNGASPAINADNLNEIERVIALADEELQRSQTICFSDYAELLYNNNTKVIEDFTDYTEWTNAYPTTCTLSDTEYYNIIGPSAVHVNEDDDTAGYIGMYKTISAIDLTEFNDGSTSTTDDCIVITFYLNDVTAFDNLQIRIGTDFSNCYYISYSSGSLISGWNAVYPQKSDFSTVGTPTGWDTIEYLRFVGYTNASHADDFVVFQYCQLVRQDPVYSGYTNFSQLEQASGYENMFDIYSDTWAIVRDVAPNLNKFGFMFLDQYYQDALNVYDDCLDFVLKVEMYPKHSGETHTITWYVDASNYARLYVTSDTLTLEIYESGGLADSATDVFDSSLLKNERITLYFEKRGQNFKGMARKGGDRLKYVNAVTAISADTSGDIRIGSVIQYAQTLITDLAISSNLGSLNIANDGNFILKQKTETQSFSNNTLADVDDMFVNLEPNSVYEIQIHLSANCSDDGPDIKTAWVLSGSATQVTQKHCRGPNLSTTSTINTNMRSSVNNITSAVSYGIDGTGLASSVNESFMVKTYQDGGKVQLQAAQYSTDGSNPTTLSTNSYLTANKHC